MSALLRRTNAIIHLQPAADYKTTNRTGYLVTFTGDVATVIAGATTKPSGVILEPPITTGTTAETMTVALLGNVAGTVQMKVAVAVTKGGFVETSGAGMIGPAGTGSTYIVGVALESGIAGDLIEVAPNYPIVQ